MKYKFAGFFPLVSFPVTPDGAVFGQPQKIEPNCTLTAKKATTHELSQKKRARSLKVVDNLFSS